MRYSAIMPDCDVMFSGHTHDGWIVTQPRLRRNEYKQKVEVVNQWHIKTGTYKEEFEMGTTLKQASGRVKLNHAHCAKFCVLGGGSCSA